MITTAVTFAPPARRAPAPDTWGISGPDFLGGFVIASLVVLGGTALALSVLPLLQRGGGGDVLRVDPTPTELALASGGEALALTVALSDLRQRSLLGSDAAPLRRGTYASADLSALARAVHDAITARGVRTRTAALQRDPAVAAELTATRRAVLALGLVLSPAQRATMRWFAIPPVALLAVGVARVYAGSGNHRPVGFLVALLLLDAVVLVALGRWARRTTLTRTGRQLLARLRWDNRHLRPALHPSWTTYGPASLLLGTALFGGGALVSADPVFADSVGARSITAYGPGLPSSGYGGDAGGGNGSSCGGSSSCGGGGCGGGGCGG